MIPGAHDPALPAVVMATSGEVLTYGELDAAANRIARLLRSMGLQPGDHIALCLENSPRFFEVVWGAHYAGLLYTACTTRLTEEELAYVVDDCGAKVVVFSPRYAGLATAIDSATRRVERRLSAGGPIDGFEPIEELAAAFDGAPACSANRSDERSAVARAASGRRSRRTNIVGTICVAVTPRSAITSSACSASKRSMTTTAAPSCWNARQKRSGAAWYSGAGER